MKHSKRALAAPFIATLTTFGLASACEGTVTREDGEGGATSTGTDAGTGTGTATATGSDTFTGTGTGCDYHPADSCGGVAEGVACSDKGAYCLVGIPCGHYPDLSSRYAVCNGTAWVVYEDEDFFPSCVPMTSTSNPPAPCPCDEPVEGTPCGHAFGQVEPCTYEPCEQYVCDLGGVGWINEPTCP